ncbi:MAG: ABC transporter substrate-binding protein [Clostridiales bacterium]|nr:ABC transporter substrate-binding protein [Clostridiales bacterium]
MKKTLCVLFTVSVLLFLLAACGGGGTADAPATQAPGTSTPSSPSNPSTSTPAVPAEPKGPNGQEYGGMVRIISSGDNSLPFGTPWVTATINPVMIVPFAEALCGETTEGVILPSLMESWEIKPEESVIIMNVRKGVKFHDGSDLTAEVVEWNFKMSQDSGYLNPGIAKVEAIGDYQIAVWMNGYLNNCLNILASHAFSLCSMENFIKNGETYAGENPVGTGPFKFNNKKIGISITYDRFDNYWQEGKPYLDNIEYVFITDVMTQNVAMMSATSDAADVIGVSSAEQMALLRDDPNLTLNLLPIGPTIMMPSGINKDSPWNKLEVRQALAWALDREAICEARGFGIFTPATQFVGEGYKGRLPDEEVAGTLGYDPVKARALLASAGYPNGFSSELFGTTSVDRETVVAIQNMLTDIGIDCEISFPEAGASTNLTQNGWEGVFFGMARAQASITTLYRRFIDPGFTYNVSIYRPDTDEFRDLYALSRSTPEMEHSIMQELSRIIRDDMIVIPIYDTYEAYVIRNNVHDSGHTKYGATTIYLPQDMWRSK